MVQIDFFCFMCCFHLTIETNQTEKQEEKKKRERRRKQKFMLYPVGYLQSLCKLHGDTVQWD